MADSERRPEMDGPQRPAEHAKDAAEGAQIPRGTDEHAEKGGHINEPREGFENPQTALGGADNVQKTSYGVGRGTDPDGRGPESQGREK